MVGQLPFPLGCEVRIKKRKRNRVQKADHSITSHHNQQKIHKIALWPCPIRAKQLSKIHKLTTVTTPFNCICYVFTRMQTTLICNIYTNPSTTPHNLLHLYSSLFHTNYYYPSIHSAISSWLPRSFILTQPHHRSKLQIII